MFLVRPGAFGFHAEAAKTNSFANASLEPGVTMAAIREFELLAEALDAAGIETLILDDSQDPSKPDAIFPNNWVSFHGDGTLVVYPMATAARRLERNVDGLRALLEARSFAVRKIVDISFHERHDHFLEGTGSLVLDRPQRRAFASVSPRTNPTVIADFDDMLDYSTLLFEAHDRSGRPIYHTNVLLSFGERFAILCSDAVVPEYRQLLRDEIEASARTVIDVSYEQMCQFACNAIELRGRNGAIIALSSAARRSFTQSQLRTLEQFGELVDADIPIIEAVGGGSVRCMIADVHLPRISQAT